MGIKYIKCRQKGNKRKKELGHYLFFARTWYVFSVPKKVKENFRKRKLFLYDYIVLLL